MRKDFDIKKIQSFLLWKNLIIRFGAFGLAVLLWLFVVSENEHTLTVEIPIEARNLPAKHALKEEVPKFAKVNLKGTGRGLFKTIILKNFISDFKLILDLERISEANSLFVCVKANVCDARIIKLFCSSVNDNVC